MTTNYNKGRYVVYGNRFSAQPMGRIDNDQYVRSASGDPLYRINGVEVYSLNDDYLCDIEQGIAADEIYETIFVIKEE